MVRSPSLPRRRFRARVSYVVSLTLLVGAIGAGGGAASVLAAAPPPPACATAPFTDVPTDHAFCPEIQWLKDNFVTNGYADATFRPGLDATRMAISAFLARVSGATLTACSSAPFNDVPTDHPFCAEIQWMKDEGISTGFNDGTFRPANFVTRQAVAAFMTRAAGVVPPACTTPPFTDVAVDHAFCKEIKWMTDEEITEGFEDDTFRPGINVTRQAIAAFIYRISLLLEIPLVIDLDPDDSDGDGPNFAATHEQAQGVTLIGDDDATITYTGTDLTSVDITVSGVADDLEYLYICGLPVPLQDLVESFMGCPDDLTYAFEILALGTDIGGGTITLQLLNSFDPTGPMPVAQWQEMLRTLAYENQDTSPTTGDRVFTITGTDSAGPVTSVYRTSTISVIENQTPNQLPVATDDAVSSWNEDGGTRYFFHSSSPTLASLIANDSDPDGDLPLTITGVSNPVGGLVFKNTLGSQPATEIQFLPTNHYHGPASFDYTLSDHRGGTDTGTVTFTINSVPDNPFPAADTLPGVAENCVDVAIDDSVLLANDFDPDNLAPATPNAGMFISALGTSTQVGGTATADSASPVSGFTFDCTSGFTGNAQFTYRVKDSSGTESGNVTVTIPVQAAGVSVPR